MGNVNVAMKDGQISFDISKGEERDILPTLIEWSRRQKKYDVLEFLLDKYKDTIDLISLTYSSMNRFDEESCLIFLKRLSNSQIESNFPNMIFDAIRLEMLEVCKYLVLERGWEINTRFESPSKQFRMFEYFEDTTPLHEAVRFGFVKIVDFLVNNGADVNAEQRYNPWIEEILIPPPMVYCLRLQHKEKSRAIFKLLVDFGACNVIKNHETFLSEAIKNENLDLFEDLLHLGVKCQSGKHFANFVDTFSTSRNYHIMVKKQKWVELWDSFLSYHSPEFLNRTDYTTYVATMSIDEPIKEIPLYPLNEVLERNSKFMIYGMIKHGARIYNDDPHVLENVSDQVLKFMKRTISFFRNKELFCLHAFEK